MGRTKITRTTIVRSGTYHDDRIWILAVILACFALLFAIIGIVTPGWNGINIIKNSQRHLSTIVLCFIAIFLIILGIIALVLFARRLITSFSSGIKMSAVIILALAGIFIVIAYSCINPYRSNNYSYYLMTIAAIFTFIASIVSAFWLGRNWITV
ncbi:unnamed protein product [Adineta steineri]|uniref:Uncharacterized protein n=1 Tax=Adineta steineri TaxID=433720 RepID=A0A819EU29_9BILA|nr:unnamed protein product [Adineta steineri]CAF3857503.1 unnamed protein product [Adineta steineri]